MKRLTEKQQLEKQVITLAYVIKEKLDISIDLFQDIISYIFAWCNCNYKDMHGTKLYLDHSVKYCELIGLIEDLDHKKEIARNYGYVAMTRNDNLMEWKKSLCT